MTTECVGRHVWIVTQRLQPSARVVFAAKASQMKNSTTVAHGGVVTPNSRYAFVTSEGVGSVPGKDVYDLRALVKVGTVDVGQQASGIASWKTEPR